MNENSLTKKNNFERYEHISSNLIIGMPDLNNEILISIVIPTYKRVDLLNKAVLSAINQINTIIKYEIIVVDNEVSTCETETEKLMKKYNDSKLLYYRNQENIGMFGNWNRCIELARGEWVSFLHDDDSLDENYINNVSKILKRKKNIGAIKSDFIIQVGNEGSFTNISKNGVIKKYLSLLDKNKIMRLRPADSEILGNVYGAPTCGNIFRKKYLLESGGFNEDYFPSADWFFLYDYSKNYRFYRTNIRFGYYRLFENESLNPNTLKAFLFQAVEFRRNIAKDSRLGLVLELLFGDERYFQTLSWVKGYDKNSVIDFDKITTELGFKNRPVRRLVFVFIQKVYWYSKRIMSIFLG